MLAMPGQMPANAPAAHRRHPFAEINQGRAMPPPAPPKDNYVQQVDLGKQDGRRQEAPKPKAPGSPPLPRQNTKTAPPSPPKIIKDNNRGLDYVRVGLLGEVSAGVAQYISPVPE
jgi:hypothetical protein